MFQVNFSEQAMLELNKLPLPEQMGLVEKLSALTSRQLAQPSEPLGKFERSGKSVYRLRAGDWRFYFELQGDQIHTRYLLHKNSFGDFLVRSRLPVDDELLLEKDPSFWKYLENLSKK